MMGPFGLIDVAFDAYMAMSYERVFDMTQFKNMTRRLA
jgi:hypothetical protein